MLRNADPWKKYAVTTLTIITGIILIFVVPDRLMLPLSKALTSYTGPESIAHLLFLYPLLNGLIIITGAAMLLLAAPIFRGDLWACALAAGFLALPAIGGAFIIETIPLFSQALVINGIILLIISLIPFLALLLYDEKTTAAKVVKVCVFFLIIIATAANLFGASEAIIQKNAAVIVDSGAAHFYYDMGIYSIFIGAILILPGITLLAGRSGAGLWLVTLGLAAMLVGSSRFSVFEHPHMILYLPAALITALTLILLILYGSRLVNHNIPGKWVNLPLNRPS